MVNFIRLEDLKDKKRASIFFAGLGAILFIIITIVAVFFYPRPYNFFMEQFSILGITDANWSKRPSIFGLLNPIPIPPPLPNPISSVMFIIAILIAAIATIPFWILFKSLFEGNRFTKIMSLIGSILGLISCPFLMAVAFPADLYLEIHSWGALGFFFLFAVAVLIYSIAMFLNKEYPNIYGIFGLIVFAIGVAYVYVPYTPLNAFHQKMTVYLFITWALVQSLKIWKEV